MSIEMLIYFSKKFEIVVRLLFVFILVSPQLPEGAYALTIGKWGEIPEQLAIAGGNCSIHGINSKNEDVLWTVTGDNVSALDLLDFNNDGYNEVGRISLERFSEEEALDLVQLLVCSEDFDIRVFREDQLIAEMQETETVVSFCPLLNSRFGYALSNGTVGIYERSTRNWRVKSRNIAVDLQSFDVNGDGIDELIIGWSNGKVIRKALRFEE